MSPRGGRPGHFNIRRTIGWLHDKGIIWGDGKADNVLILLESLSSLDLLTLAVDGDNQAVCRIFERPYCTYE